LKIVHFFHQSNDHKMYGIFNEDKNVVNIISQNGTFEREVPFSEITLLPPATPTKIVAVGLNYIEHAEEMKKPIPDEPLLFMKPSSSVIGCNDYIIIPEVSEKVDYEGELAIIIGQQCKNISENDVDNYILGYTCFNDVTARDLQIKDGQYTRSKSFDTFAPLGPWVENNIDVDNAVIQTKLNGLIVQNSNTSNMKFKPKFLVSYISRMMTLFPGDIIATGTPSGVGQIKAGDQIEVSIDGIGTLKNYVR